MYLDLACQCMTEFVYRSVTPLHEAAYVTGDLLTSLANLKLLISLGELRQRSFPGRAHNSRTHHLDLPQAHVRSRRSTEAWHCKCCMVWMVI